MRAKIGNLSLLFMNSKEFTQKCSEIWGYGYQTKAAKELGISRTTAKIYVKGVTTHGKIVTIKQETADRLMGIWCEFKRNKKAAG